jgi:hypothetical protein
VAVRQQGDQESLHQARLSEDVTFHASAQLGEFRA